MISKSRILLRWVVVTALAGFLVLFLGRPGDPWLVAYVVTFFLLGLYAVAGMRPDLARERFTPPTLGADAGRLHVIRLIALAHIVAGVADGRFGWTLVPGSLRAAGLFAFATGFLVIVRASRENRFFSAVVRVQDERGHSVVATGPYAVVRHPGYVGMLTAVPGSGLALGSWLAVGFALLYAALIVRRVIFEDAFLRHRLAGYAAYSVRVPWRLVPGLW